MPSRETLKQIRRPLFALALHFGRVLVSFSRLAIRFLSRVSLSSDGKTHSPLAINIRKTRLKVLPSERLDGSRGRVARCVIRISQERRRRLDGMTRFFITSPELETHDLRVSLLVSRS